MNILVVSTMFPCKRHPTSAIFFANLMTELAPKVDGLTIITPRVYIPKFLTKIKKRWARWYIDPMISKENGIEIIRPFFLSLRGLAYQGINGILMQYSLSRLVKRLVREKRIDLILGYNMIPEGIATVRLAKKINLPSGFWAIGSDVNDFAKYNRVNHYLSKKCIEGSDLVLTESRDLEERIRDLGNPDGKVTTFYKGIDLSSFQNLPDKNIFLEKLQLSSDKKYLLFVGRLIYDKGIYELVDVFKYVANKYPSYELILIGEEIEKDKLQAKFNKYGLLNKVHFKGIIPHKKVAHYMKVSDLLILPTWAEGLPNVIMEAMAVGLPVVATNVGGIPEILDNGITGLSVPPKDVDKLALSVIKMIEDKDLRKKCIKNGKELISDKFDVKKNAVTIYNILKDMKEHYSRPS